MNTNKQFFKLLAALEITETEICKLLDISPSTLTAWKRNPENRAFRKTPKIYVSVLKLLYTYDIELQ